MKIDVTGAALRGIEQTPVEVVERKGRGHPDTLADEFAEHFVTEYVRWCRRAFGVDLNHWVDKCVLIGGASRNGFGQSSMTVPIRAMVIGKAARAVGDVEIPLEEIATTAAHRALTDGLVGFEPQDCRVEVHTNDYTGSGRPTAWYQPTSSPRVAAVRRSNDTVVCTGYAPLSRTERLTVGLESYLTSDGYRAGRTATGTDVKVLATRRESAVSLVVCVPALPCHVATRGEYDDFRAGVVEDVRQFVDQHGEGLVLDEVHLNTRDDAETVYLAHLGSAIATGDVGAVGRGNRLNGVIAPGRRTHLEAPAGKNPFYHGGKVALVLAQRLAERLSARLGDEVEVCVVAENGQSLADPSLVSVELASSCDAATRATVDETVRDELGHVEELTERLATRGLAGALGGVP
jgi:S-adenosylmethionine synthetase